MDPEQINALLTEAWNQRRAGNHEQARALVQKAEAGCGKEDYLLLGRVYHVKRQLEADHGVLEKALQYSLDSVRYYRLSGNTDRIAHSTRHLADLQQELGQLEEAGKHYRKAISIYRENPDTGPGDLANGLRAWALLLEKQDHWTEAGQLWKEVMVLYQGLGLLEGVEEARNKLNSFNS